MSSHPVQRRRPPAPQEPGKPRHLTFAQHIRGSIAQGQPTATGRPHYWFTVTNLSNGIQIARADAFTLEDALRP